MHKKLHISLNLQIIIIAVQIIHVKQTRTLVGTKPSTKRRYPQTIFLLRPCILRFERNLIRARGLSNVDIKLANYTRV